MKTKGRLKSKNVIDKRFEKAQPKGRPPFATLKAQRERRLAAIEARSSTEYTLDQYKRNELIKNTTVRARGRKATVKVKVTNGKK